jgi:GNAT superfamily N-acetyltransferase
MVEIRTVKHLDEKDLLVDLFRISFGQNMSAELWDWKYIQNPLSSTAAEVIVALEEGKIVGARPFLLTEMWIENKKVVTAQHCDTMVHPEHRNKGIFNAMGQFAIKYLREHSYALSYGFPGPMSRPGFLSQGYRIVAPIDIGFWPINGRKLLSHKLKNRLLGNGLGYIYDKLLHTKKRPAIQNIFKVETFDQFTDELKDIDTLREGSEIDLVRSEANLRWRFDYHPRHHYKYILAKIDQKLCGYALISIQEQPNGQIYGIIIDYLIKGGDIACFRTLMDRSLQEFEKSECDIVVIWAFSDPIFMDDLLKNFGFKSSTKFPYNRAIGHSYLDVILIDDRIIERINIYDKANWRITYAYQDFA